MTVLVDIEPKMKRLYLFLFVHDFFKIEIYEYLMLSIY